jgi:hypothetical protein
MARTEVRYPPNGTRNINAGTYPPVGWLEANLEAGASRIFVALYRDAWGGANTEEVVRIRCEISLDGGVTWPWLVVDIGAVGGTVNDPKTGLPYDRMEFSNALPEPGNTNRRIRARATFAIDLSTAIEVRTA